MTAPASPSDWLSRRSGSALAQLSGPAVFARGQTYASSGAIEEQYTLLLEALALQLPPEQHAAAVQLRQRVFGPLMARASSPYTEPLALVKKILQRMAPAQQAPWLATLRVQDKPKRNFLAGLP